jgi:hypothetical protein
MTESEQLAIALKALMDVAEENNNLTLLGCRGIATRALGELGWARAWVRAAQPQESKP